MTISAKRQPYIDACNAIASEIVAQVSAATGVATDDILGNSRHREFAEARQIAAFLMRQRSAHGKMISYQLIAKAICRDDHTTMIYAVRKVVEDEGLARIAAGIALGRDVTQLCLERWHSEEIERQRRKAERTPSRSQLAAELVADGTHSLASAARAHGITVEAVRMRCLRLGIKPNRAIGRAALKAKRSPETRARMAAAQRKRGIELREQRGIDPHRLVEMAERGVTYSGIAEAIGVSRCAVAGLIHRARKSIGAGA